MLYDPKWEVETKADPFKLKSLVGWLEKQDPTTQYCYDANGHCLLSQYFIAAGLENVCMYTDCFLHGERKKYNPGRRDIARDDGEQVWLPHNFNSVAIGSPRTFGAALARARAML